MLWIEKWKRIDRWIDRLPLWVQVTVFPPFAPPLVVLALASVSPLTAATSVVAGTILAVAYGWLLGQGIFSWADIGKQLVALYLFFVLISYGAMVEYVLDRLLPKKAAGSSPEPEVALASDTAPDRDRADSPPLPGG